MDNSRSWTIPEATQETNVPGPPSHPNAQVHPQPPSPPDADLRTMRHRAPLKTRLLTAYASIPTRVQRAIVWLAVLPFFLMLLENIFTLEVSLTWAIIFNTSLLVASAAWAFGGIQAIVTGQLSSFSGVLQHRPVLYRFVGVGLIWVGIQMLLQGGFGLARAILGS